MGIFGSSTAEPSENLSQGIQKNRKCRDVVFILLFAIYWVGMFIVCATAIENGDIRRLTVPRDYNGNYCGYDNGGAGPNSDLRNQRFLYFINPFNLQGVNSTFVCVEACPSESVAVTDFQNAACAYDSRPTDSVTYLQNIQNDKCAPYNYSSTPIFQRCVPDAAINASLFANTTSSSSSSVEIQNFVNSGRDQAALVVSDLYNTWPILLVSAFTAILVSLGWLYIAHFAVGPFVWGSIIMLNTVAIISTIILYFFWSNRNTAFKNGTASSSQVDITAAGYTISDNLSFLSTNAVVTQWDVNLALGIFITVAIFTGLFLLITIVMIKRIRMAIEIINEASEAFRSLPGIQFAPLVFAVPLGLLLVYFIYIMLYLMTPTSDNITISGFGFTYSSKNSSYYMVWYHMGGFIWAFYTIQGMLQLTIAGAVAEWYWTFDKKTTLQAPVLNSVIRAFKYSFGSVILGSLLITIVELIRIALYNLQKQIASSPNPWLKYLVSCAQCCMKCIQVIMKWINRNAYVYIAITGKAFFAAAGCATALLLRNAAKTVAVTYVGEAALILAKIAIVGFNCILSYAFMYYFPTVLAEGVTNPTLTVVMVGVITYTVASLFLSNYQLAIDTIFLSALEDLDKNDGSASRPFFMSDSLKKILQKKNDGKVDQL